MSLIRKLTILKLLYRLASFERHFIFILLIQILFIFNGKMGFNEKTNI